MKTSLIAAPKYWDVSHNDAKLCEQVFLAQPKAHRGKYAKKHKVMENNMLKLQEYFWAVTMWTFAVADINAF